MLFEKLLMPDYRFESFSEVTPEFLRKIGVTALISDIDNTLVPYEIQDATEEIKEWVTALREGGVSVAFVSNNHAGRVERFNRELGCPAYSDVGKPGTKYLRRAMDDMGAKTGSTAFLGDQLLTDALAAHRLHIPMIAVPPIKDKTTLFFKFKRRIEKPYMKKFLSNLQNEHKQTGD